MISLTLLDSLPMMSSWGTRYFTLSILGRDFSRNIQQFQLSSDIILCCINLLKLFNKNRNLWGKLLFYILNCQHSPTETVSFLEAFVSEVWRQRSIDRVLSIRWELRKCRNSTRCLTHLTLGRQLQLFTEWWKDLLVVIVQLIIISLCVGQL